MRWSPPLNKHHQASPLPFLLQLPHHLWQAIDSKAVSLTLLLKETNMKSRVNSNHNIILTLLLQVVSVHAKAKTFFVDPLVQWVIEISFGKKIDR